MRTMSLNQIKLMSSRIGFAYSQGLVWFRCMLHIVPGPRPAFFGVFVISSLKVAFTINVGPISEVRCYS